MKAPGLEAEAVARCVLGEWVHLQSDRLLLVLLPLAPLPGFQKVPSAPSACPSGGGCRPPPSQPLNPSTPLPLYPCIKG